VAKQSPPWVFCQAGPLTLVALSQIFDRRTSGWRLAALAEHPISIARALFESLAASGIRMVARSAAMAHVVTAMMKRSGQWCTEGRINFSLRRTLARRTTDWLPRNVQLVEVQPAEFGRASDLWFAHYREELHQQRAGFDDYLDAALILSPMASRRIAHVLIDHNHLPYILGKAGGRVTAHYLPSEP
jgi:hypothetical protein